MTIMKAMGQGRQKYQILTQHFKFLIGPKTEAVSITASNF